MKCPKCGFTSFDYLRECRKCGKNLEEIKAKFNLRSILFPAAAAAGAPAVGEAPEAVADFSPADPTDFGFDFMPDEGASDPVPGAGPDDLFVADEEAMETPASDPETLAPEYAPGASENSGDEFDFGGDDFDFDGAPPEEPSPLARGNDPAAALPEEGEMLDLDLDLSWDDSGSASAASTEPSRDIELPEVGPLPSLEEPEELPAGDVDAFLSEGAGDLLEWDFEDFDGQESAEGSTGEEEPRDPFDRRESASERAPETPAASDDASEFGPERTGGDLSPRPAAAPEPSEEIRGAQEGAEPFAGDPELPWPSAPAGEFTPEEPGFADPSLPLPSRAARAAATVVDLLLLAGGFLLFVAAGEVALSPGEGRILPAAADLPERAAPYFLVLFFLFFGYFTLFHYLTGQTAGKMLLKLRVESQGGDPLTFSQAFLRSAGGLLCLLPAGLGYVRLLSASGGRSWNDSLAGTRVVGLDSAAEESGFGRGAEGPVSGGICP